MGELQQAARRKHQHLKKMAVLPVMALTLAIGACSSLTEQSQTRAVPLAPAHAELIDGQPVPVTAHSHPLSLLENDDPRLAANKRLVWDMWRTVVEAGHVEAADRFLTEDYIQHNPTLPTGRDAFKANLGAFVERQDEVAAEVQGSLVTIVAEGDYVVMAFVTEYEELDGSGSYTSTHFDMFRIENQRIAEHWDSIRLRGGEEVPSPEDGGPVPVVGVQGEAQLEWLHSDDTQLRENKRLVFDMWRHMPEAGKEELAPLYMDPIYIQHNPNATTGRDGVVEYFSQRPDTPIAPFLEDPLIAMLAEDNLVVQVLQEERPHPDRPGEIYYVPWFDMFRVQNGRLAEHWDTAATGELPAIMQGEQ